MSDTLKVNVGDEIPVVLTMKGAEKSGQNQYGNWHLYRFGSNGQNVGYFAKDPLHYKLKDLDAGTKVTLVGKNNPQGKGVIVDLVLANGVSETPTTTNTTTTSTGSITDTVVIAAASSLVGSKFTEEDYLSRCKTIAETYSTVHGYTVPGKVEKLEEVFDGKEEASEEKMPWDDD
jgi:hypothetical protein